MKFVWYNLSNLKANSITTLSKFVLCTTWNNLSIGNSLNLKFAATKYEFSSHLTQFWVFFFRFYTVQCFATQAIQLKKNFNPLFKHNLKKKSLFNTEYLTDAFDLKILSASWMTWPVDKFLDARTNFKKTPQFSLFFKLPMEFRELMFYSF